MWIDALLGREPWQTAVDEVGKELDVVLTWLTQNTGVTGSQQRDAKERADELESIR